MLTLSADNGHELTVTVGVDADDIREWAKTLDGGDVTVQELVPPTAYFGYYSLIDQANAEYAMLGGLLDEGRVTVERLLSDDGDDSCDVAGELEDMAHFLDDYPLLWEERYHELEAETLWDWAEGELGEHGLFADYADVDGEKLDWAVMELHGAGHVWVDNSYGTVDYDAMNIQDYIKDAFEHILS